MKIVSILVDVWSFMALCVMSFLMTEWTVYNILFDNTQDLSRSTFLLLIFLIPGLWLSVYKASSRI